MLVRAIAFGEYLGKRKIGDEFEFEGKPSGKWMEPVDDAARAAFEKAGIKVATEPVVPAHPAHPARPTHPAHPAHPAPVEKGKGAGSTGDKSVI